MNVENSRLQSDFEFSFYEHQREPDVRRDPNYVMLLFVLIVLMFIGAMALIFLTNGQLPFMR